MADAPLDPRLTEPQLSNRLAGGVVRGLYETYGEPVVNEAIRAAGLPVEYLLDPERWVSAIFLNDFLRHLSRATGGEDVVPGPDHPISHAIARTTRRRLAREALGPAIHAVVAFASPTNFYRILPKRMELFIRVAEASVRLRGAGHVEIRMHARPGVADPPWACAARRSLFEALPTIWSLPPARVEHPACTHRGDAECAYDVRYSDGTAQRWGRLALAAAAGTALALLLANLLHAARPGLAAALALGVGVAVEGWRRALRFARLHADGREELLRHLADSDRLHADAWREAALRQSLLRFFPPRTTRRLIESQGGALEILDAEVTALFCDISDYTALASTMPPREVIELLNAYFPCAVEVVFRHEGTLEKYIGDALLAVWGAPYPQPDDADRAVAAALELRAAVGRLAAEGRIPRPIRVHIGVHSGPAAAGNIGSAEYIQYATIGDATNVAARVCAAASPDEILISADTKRRLARPVRLEALPPATVKGKRDPLELYRVLA